MTRLNVYHFVLRLGQGIRVNVTHVQYMNMIETRISCALPPSELIVRLPIIILSDSYHPILMCTMTHLNVFLGIDPPLKEPSATSKNRMGIDLAEVTS